MKCLSTVITASTLAAMTLSLAAQAGSVDLLERYPARLIAGDLVPARARPWKFTEADMFQLSHFNLTVGKALKIEIGPADLGIGHCTDGAVWAVVVPRENGKLTSDAAAADEPIAHVWLRFHPKEVTKLFPKETVSTGCPPELESQIRAIANHKLRASYHAGPNVLVPERKDFTVDVDTKNGPRRFFIVDTKAGTAQYVNAFENQPVRLPPTRTSAAARP
jgi:hypothetical protein